MCNIGIALGHRHAIYINVLKGMLMYIACLCPNLVSVHFYAIPILHFKFPKFVIYLHRRRKRGSFGGAITNRRRAHAQGYSSCVSGSGASVRPKNAVTYSAGNGGKTICGGFSETAPLQRSNTPSAKGHMNARMCIMP